MSSPFDEARYMALLEGLEATEVKIKEILENNYLRLDSDFFAHSQTKSLEKLKEKKTFKPLKIYLDYISSGHTPLRHNLSEGEIDFITVECIKNLTLDREKLKKITSQQYELEYKQNRADKQRVICTIKRRICQAYAFLEKPDKPLALNQDVSIMYPKANLNAAYLATYLNCAIGQSFADKQKTGQMNPYISVANLATLPFYLASNDFQTKIEHLLKKSYAIQTESKTLYTAAENELLEAIGLKDWTPTIKNNNEKTLKESFLQSGRFDAEYYQPKYDEILNQIKPIKNDTLGKIVSIQKSIEPGSDAYNTEGLPFIRVADLSKQGISKSSVFLSKEDFGNFEIMPKKDTILLSKDGSVGIAYKVEEDIKGITSGAILHLTITRQDVLPDYLCLVLNSKIVQLQAERDAGGSIIQHWKPDEIKQVVIPIIDKPIQTAISEKVQKSFALQKESKALLEAAKRAVEIAIEEDEEAALSYLNNLST